MGVRLYRPDIDQVYDRLTTWWNGGDIGRPAMLVYARRDKPIEDIPMMPEPEGWVSEYSPSDLEYRVNLAARACIHTHYLGEAVPDVCPNLGPNCLALYLGCTGVEKPGTMWFRPCIERPEMARFEFDPDNFYWQFTLRLIREQLRIGKDRFLTSFPDLIEGLDTLAAMRGTQKLLVDLIERPAWVHDALEQITERWFDCYDILYELIKDERGGTHFWCWAPGRMGRIQCDFSAMISPTMFEEFMVPVLNEMAERFDYCMYHWDGPGALVHLDHLLSIPGIDLLQWTPGAGEEPVMDRKWWHLYHRTLDAGKKVILIGDSRLEYLKALKKEFGVRLRQFMIMLHLDSLQEAEEMMRVVSE